VYVPCGTDQVADELAVDLRTTCSGQLALAGLLAVDRLTPTTQWLSSPRPISARRCTPIVPKPAAPRSGTTADDLDELRNVRHLTSARRQGIHLAAKCAERAPTGPRDDFRLMIEHGGAFEASGGSEFHVRGDTCLCSDGVARRTPSHPDAVLQTFGDVPVNALGRVAFIETHQVSNSVYGLQVTTQPIFDVVPQFDTDG
jgi:hypothetical protein